MKESKTKASRALVMGKMNFLHTTFLIPEIPLFYLGTAKAGQGSWSVNSYVGHGMGINGWISGFVLFNEDTIPQPSPNTNVLSHLAWLRLNGTSVSWIAIINLTYCSQILEYSC